MSETTTIDKKEGTPGEGVAKQVPPVKVILARKIGMTRVFSDKGDVVPVTVLEAGPCPIIHVTNVAKNGYAAIQLGFGGAKAKNFSKPEAGHFQKASQSPTRWLGEFRLKSTEGFEPGMQVRVEQFKAGDVVDASGVNKGKGFAGSVKRHRFKGGPQTHGQSDRWRAPGSSGRERVWPGKRGPGHMGAVVNTVQRLQVVRVDPEQNVMLIKGSVPGPNGACVRIYQTTRPRRAPKAGPVSKKTAKAPAKK